MAEGRPWVSPAFSPPSQVAERREGRWRRAGRWSHLPSLHQARWLGGGKAGGGGQAVGLTCKAGTHRVGSADTGGTGRGAGGGAGARGQAWSAWQSRSKDYGAGTEEPWKKFFIRGDPARGGEGEQEQ